MSPIAKQSHSPPFLPKGSLFCLASAGPDVVPRQGQHSDLRPFLLQSVLIATGQNGPNIR